MDRNTYLDIVKDIQPGAFFRLAWEKDEAPAAAHRKAGVVLTKRVRAVVRAGIDFANMKRATTRSSSRVTRPPMIPASSMRGCTSTA